MRLVLASSCLAAFVVTGCGSSSTGMDMAVSLADLATPAPVSGGPPECDIIANTGCPAGQKCTIGTDTAGPRTICFAIASPAVAAGGDCMPVTMGTRTGDNCAAGLSCVDYPGEGKKCRTPCFFRQTCGTGQACVVPTTSFDVAGEDGGNPTLLDACHSDDGCDPVAQSVCTGGKGCYLSRADDVGRVGVCLMDVKPGMDGADCSHITDCAPGFRCDSFQFCRRYCYFQDANGGTPTSGQCPAGEGNCALFSFSGSRYGICGAL